MIRNVGNNGGANIDPSSKRGGKEAFADKIAGAKTLGALKTSVGSGEGLPSPHGGGGGAVGRFSKDLALGPEILSGIGAEDKAATINTLRSEARRQTKTDPGS